MEWDGEGGMEGGREGVREIFLLSLTCDVYIS